MDIVYRRATALAPHVTRYGLVLVIGWIGLCKFTPTEAAGIEGLVRHSPFMSWMYRVLSVQGVSNVIGATELAVAALIALRPWSPRLSAVGSLGAALMFFTTISFMFTTPGAFGMMDWLFAPLGAGQFLIKDVVLLGGALWTAAEAAQAGPTPPG